MTIETCLQLVDDMMPNCLPADMKLRFLGEVEGRVRVELLGEDPSAVSVLTSRTPTGTELTVPYPFDQLYWQYLLAMLGYVSGDTARYENAALLFNASYQSYGKWLKRRGA